MGAVNNDIGGGSALSQHGIIFSAAREIGKCEIALSLALCPMGALFISGGRKEEGKQEM